MLRRRGANFEPVAAFIFGAFFAATMAGGATPPLVTAIPKCCPTHQVMDDRLGCRDVPEMADSPSHPTTPEMATRQLFVESLCKASGSGGDRCPWLRSIVRFIPEHHGNASLKKCAGGRVAAEAQLVDMAPGGDATLLLPSGKTGSKLVKTTFGAVDACADLAVARDGALEGPVVLGCFEEESNYGNSDGLVRKCCPEGEVILMDKEECVKPGPHVVGQIGWLPARMVRHPVTETAVTEFQTDRLHPKRLAGKCVSSELQMSEKALHFYHDGKVLLSRGK